jgi:hypothetical protein
VAEALVLSFAAAITESAGMPSFSRASAATSGIVSPSGTVNLVATSLPEARMFNTFQAEVPGWNW